MKCHSLVKKNIEAMNKNHIDLSCKQVHSPTEHSSYSVLKILDIQVENVAPSSISSTAQQWLGWCTPAIPAPEAR